MTPSIKSSLHQVIEALSEAECRQVLEYVRQLPIVGGATVARLQSDPTFKLPTPKMVQFQVVEPLPAEGLPASCLLQKDRR